MDTNTVQIWHVVETRDPTGPHVKKFGKYLFSCKQGMKLAGQRKTMSGTGQLYSGLN